MLGSTVQHRAMSASPRPTVREIGSILLIVLALFIPDVAIELTPLGPDAPILIAGMLPALIAWTYAPRYAVATIPLSALFNGVAVYVFGRSLATTLFILVVAVLVGGSALRGWQPIAIFIAIQPALSVVSGYRTVFFGEVTPGVAVQALICAGVAAVGGSWAVLVGATLLRNASSGPPDPVPGPVVIFYTGALVVLLGPTAFIASTWFLSTTAGWVLLTILLVLRPTYDESRLMLVERALGTVVGAILAAVLAVLVPNTAVLVWLGTVSMVVAAVAQLLHARYAYFAAAVTLAIVLLNAERTNVFARDLERVLYTLVGVVVVAIMVTLAEILLGRHTPVKPAGQAVG